jgi:hypothetical protein
VFPDADAKPTPPATKPTVAADAAAILNDLFMTTSTPIWYSTWVSDY